MSNPVEGGGPTNTTRLPAARTAVIVLVNADASQEMTEHLLKCEDPEKFPRFLPADVKFAMKTGSVSDSRTIAGILMIPKAGGDTKKPDYHRVAVCILTAENKDKRFTADSAGDTLIAKMLKEIFDHFSK